MPESLIEKDRRRWHLRDVIPLVIIVTNIAALVWGAAKMSDSIDDLKVTVSDLRVTTRGLAADIANVKIDYNARIKVLEDRYDRHK